MSLSRFIWVAFLLFIGMVILSVLRRLLVWV